eukprot:11717212-Ditylum_brightwellii.AAC.1
MTKKQANKAARLSVLAGGNENGTEPVQGSVSRMCSLEGVRWRSGGVTVHCRLLRHSMDRKQLVVTNLCGCASVVRLVITLPASS